MYGGRCLDYILEELRNYTVPAGDILNYDHVTTFNQGSVLANYSLLSDYNELASFERNLQEQILK